MTRLPHGYTKRTRFVDGSVEKTYDGPQRHANARIELAHHPDGIDALDERFDGAGQRRSGAIRAHEDGGVSISVGHRR